MSHHESAAQTTVFDEQVNVVFGENDVGKSHLIKSIYAAFGADAAIVNDRWLPAIVIIALEFSVNGIVFTIVRMGGKIALFDSANAMLWCETSIVKEVGPRIAEIMDFGIRLSTVNGDLINPPPQFCFLPFYQDQDRGWSDQWASFKALRMIPRYKQSMLEYHTGIRPKEYYAALADRSEALRKQAEFRAELSALDRAMERLRSSREGPGLAFRPEEFASQISRLETELNEIQNSYREIRHRVGLLQSERAALVEQIEIANNTLRELDADFRYVQDVVLEEVTCPTCHATYHNDFASRFSLIGDADACRGFLIDAREKLTEVENKLVTERRSLNRFKNKSQEIHQILGETRDQVRLADMLKDESERILDKTILSEREEIKSSISHWLLLERESSEIMNSLSSPRRKKEIISFYASKLEYFSHQLGVNFSPMVFKSVSPTINETGSFGTRAILAYHYAVLHTIQKFSTSCLAPVVIDTPLQQDQDKENAEAILNFIRDERPSDLQLVLGTVSLHNVEYPGGIFRPMDKHHLLDANLYESVAGYLNPFCNEMMGKNPGLLL